MNTWNDLSLSEKSEMMRVAIENGITTLPEIKEAYNQFAEGGNIYSGEDEPTQKMKRPVTTSGAGYIPSSPSIQPIDLPKSIEDARLRIYNQVSPAWGFTDDTVKAFFDTMIHNTNNFYEAYKNKEKDEFGRPIPSPIVDSPYVDGVWAEYLQIPKEKRRSKYVLTKSKYTPTIGDNSNATYYTIPIDNETKETLVKEGEVLPVGKNKLSTTLMGYNHGEHTIGKGIDPKRGEYISYYDRWDLNPLSSRYSAETKLKDNPVLKKLGLLDNKRHGDLSFGLGKPLDFYDRIYLDDYYGVGSSGINPLTEPDTYYGEWLPELEVLDLGNGFSVNKMGNSIGAVTRNGKEKAYGGNLFSGEENHSSQMHQGYVYDVLPKMLKEAGLNVRVTSGYRRPGQAGKAGSRSWHTHHGAVDIVPQGKTTFEDIENALYNNPTISRYMIDNGFGLIDESGRTAESKATMKKTGATGAHFHIGKDSKAVSAYNNKMSSIWDSNMSQLETAINQPALPVFMPSNPQAFFAPLESYQRPVVVEEPLVQAAMENPYSPEQLEREERAQGLRNLGLAMSIMRGGQEQSYSPLWSAVSMLSGNQMAKGGKIHIKPSHRGRLTELKKSTGKTEAELYKNGSAATRKMITFARNARKWKHGLGGHLFGEDARLTFLDFI